MKFQISNNKCQILEKIGVISCTALLPVSSSVVVSRFLEDDAVERLTIPAAKPYNVLQKTFICNNICRCQQALGSVLNLLGRKI